MSNSVCDNCKREPTPFKTDKDETAYWLQVPKENQDPSHISSSLEFVFIAMVPENGDKRHPINDKENYYWCAACCGAAYPDQEIL